MQDDFKYTKSHEWLRLDNSKAMIGITEYAQDALGDIVYVELPTVGQKINKGDEVVNVESVKVAEAIYAPVSGTIVEVNKVLVDAPETINKDPYGAFIFVMDLTDPSELEELLDAESYAALLGTPEQE